MFSHDPKRHKEWGFYFSPSAVELYAVTLAAMGAVDCNPPPAPTTSLLVGHADAKRMLNSDG